MSVRVLIHLLSAVIAIFAIGLMYGLATIRGMETVLTQNAHFFFPIWFMMGYFVAFMNLKKFFNRRR